MLFEEDEVWAKELLLISAQLSNIDSGKGGRGCKQSENSITFYEGRPTELQWRRDEGN